MTTAQDLIARSVSHDEIAHAPYSAELAAELGALADDSADTIPVVEFWGEGWRVHLDRDRSQQDVECGAVVPSDYDMEYHQSEEEIEYRTAHGK